MKNAVFAFLAACALVAPAAMAQITPPDVLAKSVTDEVLALIRADKELQAGNPKRIAELIETKIAPHFSFTLMTQLAMGRNWNQANAQQKKALTAEFRALLVRTYTTAFTQYSNQTIEYRALKLAPADTDVIVRSQIRQPGGPPVSVDYRMDKSDTGWKVYDVRIEGISLVENYRNTFNSEVQKGGIDGLIKSLAEKNKALLAQAPAK
ncbi:MAG: ABC transporter substrate-binding protein [Betaproteobacteria bacterium]|nr:ABC transporter substrate-binding protein [Betaproteobacteria bacterium]